MFFAEREHHNGGTLRATQLANIVFGGGFGAGHGRYTGSCSQVRMIASASSGCAPTTSPTFLMEDSRTWPSMREISIMLSLGAGSATCAPPVACAWAAA